MLRLRRLGAGCAVGAATALAAALAAPGALAAAAKPAGPLSFSASDTANLLAETAQAWTISQGSGVTVAVLSTGVDPNADGLQGKVTVGGDYVNLPFPEPTSGTILASAIAGSGSTSGGVIGPLGRAPQAKILSIRVWPDSNVPGAQAYANSQPQWETSDATGITEAVDSGAKVIVDDLVGGDASSAMEEAVQYAIAKNVVVVCDEDPSASDLDGLLYPCALPGVIGAATVDLPGLPPPSPAVGSPANETILVAAPGNQLLASGPQGPDYAVQNYYSSLAWLAGTAALIKSVYPNLAPALVARAIAVSATDRPPGGYNTTVGFGLINPDGALQQAAVLSKLGDTAAPGPGVFSPSARLAPGPPPGVIVAVHHSTLKLAGYGGAIVAGLACLIAALLLGLRWRRPARAVAPAGPWPLGATPGQVPSFPVTAPVPPFPGWPVPGGQFPAGAVPPGQFPGFPVSGGPVPARGGPAGPFPTGPASADAVPEGARPPVPPGPDEEGPPPQPPAADGPPPQPPAADGPPPPA
jgi:Subtilase family